MKISVKINFLIFLVVSLFIPGWIFSDGDTFTVAGLQYQIEFENYSSHKDFFRKIESNVEEICRDSKVELIIFPEYIGVFYQLIRYNEIIRTNESFQSALRGVLAENPRFHSMIDVFLADTDDLKSYTDGWSEISKKHGVSIIAGSCFAPGAEGELRNRSFVFNEEGRLIYQQDKVFLTEFESDIIGLTPGSLDAASFFQVGGQDIALTICRDTYSSEWETKNSGAFLWVDIKANGESYSLEQQRSFMRALPLRMIRTDVKFGITVCTVGSYLDLFWEGESTALYKDGDKLALADISEDFRNNDCIILKICMEQ